VRVVEIVPRSALRVAAMTGVATAIAIMAATACLTALASVTGVDRSVNRLVSAFERGHHVGASQVLLGAGVALAVLALLGWVVVGLVIALFANPVLEVSGGVRVAARDADEATA